MPKRYRVVSGSDEFTWEYIDDTNEPWVLLAESFERWNTKDEVKAEIREMKKAEVKEGRDGKPKPGKRPRP